MRRFQLGEIGKLAFLGGAYGNLLALDAALADAREQGCEALVFLGDALAAAAIARKSWNASGTSSMWSSPVTMSRKWPPARPLMRYGAGISPVPRRRAVPEFAR